MKEKIKTFWNEKVIPYWEEHKEPIIKLGFAVGGFVLGAAYTCDKINSRPCYFDINLVAKNDDTGEETVVETIHLSNETVDNPTE